MNLYKYRGVKNLKFYVDIILNKRLYAAPYFDMNDPMEGHYLYGKGEFDSDIQNLIKGQKRTLRICSLSKTPQNELMWAHYAEGHRGVALKVDVKNEDARPVRYGNLPQIGFNSLNNHTGRDVLLHKLKVWKYEQEMRVFTEGSMYIDVDVIEVILGRSMSKQGKSFIKKLTEAIDPTIEISSAIEVYS